MNFDIYDNGEDQIVVSIDNSSEIIVKDNIDEALAFIKEKLKKLKFVPEDFVAPVK